MHMRFLYKIVIKLYMISVYRISWIWWHCTKIQVIHVYRLSNIIHVHVYSEFILNNHVITCTCRLWTIDRYHFFFQCLFTDCPIWYCTWCMCPYLDCQYNTYTWSFCTKLPTKIKWRLCTKFPGYGYWYIVPK